MVKDAYIGGEKMKEDYEPKKIITFFNFFIDIKNKVKGWLGIERD
jgi:hypothetical protein